MINWKKDDKEIYLPSKKPSIVNIPKMKYFTVTGEGDPNSFEFQINVKKLYALSYGVKMSPKKGIAPENYEQYTIYPLEGHWDISDEAKRLNKGFQDKKDLKYTIMIRQPNFITKEFAEQIIELTKKKKPELDFTNSKFEEIEDGTCVQMLHLGSYDNEPASFQLMEQFAIENGTKRTDKTHKEIYLSDPRKTESSKLKTVLRFKI